MSFPFIQSLIAEETRLTSGNVHQFAGPKKENLTSREEFKDIEKADAQFARKLVVAWEGDAKDYLAARHRKQKFDALFPKMLDEKNLQKMGAKFELTPELKKSIDMLKLLHVNTYPEYREGQDNSPWAYERMVRESQEDESLMEEYRQLCELLA